MDLWSDRWGGEEAKPAPAAPERPWTVGELTRAVRARLEGLGKLSVEGEIVGLKQASSGHLYFGLKDIDARIDCAIWKSARASALKSELVEGQRVVAHGRLDVYAPRGTYSLIVTRVEPAGIGTLLAKLEELRARLAAEGWFERRRSLPVLPRVVGVVTSRDGAAFQDFLRTRSRRWPGYPLRLVHTPVQGAGAADSIAAAIARMDRSGVDVICIVRGGGSLEDLWAFNELAVLTAIRAATVPVVSGVGHETDTTLSDLVADRRAHTPTDAAQVVIPDRSALAAELERAQAHLARALDAAVETRAARLERASRMGQLLRTRIARAAERLARGAERLAAQAPAARLERQSGRVERAAGALRAGLVRVLDPRAAELATLERALSSVSPYAVLSRGYSITREIGAEGSVRDARRLAAGAELETVFHVGRARSRVESVEGGA